MFAAILALHAELGGRDARPVHTLGPDHVGLDGQRAERAIAVGRNEGEMLRGHLDGSEVLVAGEEVDLLRRGDVEHVHRPAAAAGDCQ